MTEAGVLDRVMQSVRAQADTMTPVRREAFTAGAECARQVLAELAVDEAVGESIRALIRKLQEMDEDIRAKEWLAARLHALEEVCRGCRRNLCGCPANRMIASSAAASVLREVEGAD